MDNRELNILYVTSHLPHGDSYGAQLRTLNIGRMLKRVGKVSLVIASSDDYDQRDLERTAAEFNVRYVFRVGPDRSWGAGSRMRYELDPAFLNTHFTRVDERDRKLMKRLIGEHDVVWVHTVRTANEFRIYRWPHTVLDLDDIPSRVYASRARDEGGMIRNLLDYRLSLIWRRREHRLSDRFDVIGVCSDADRRYMNDDARTQVIPNGFERPLLPPRRSVKRPARLGFIGLCSYEPNRAGLEWFIREVWPLIRTEEPGTRLRLAGRESDRDLPKMGPGIDGLGYLENPEEEIATWTAMVVPVRVGGGTRIKIVEAFSRKCPVVATTLGAFGYEHLDGKALVLADRPRDFADACLRLIRDRAYGDALSDRAWNGFLREWTWDAVGASVEGAVRLCRELQTARPGSDTTIEPALF